MKKQWVTLGIVSLIMGFFTVSPAFAQETAVDPTVTTVTRNPDGSMQITGLPSPVESVETRNVIGEAPGTLRIQWAGNGSGSVEPSPVSPPGAPELPANVMFGSGFLFLGLGLLLYRKLW